MVDNFNGWDTRESPRISSIAYEITSTGIISLMPGWGWIMKDKKLYSLQRLAERFDYPDTTICNYMPMGLMLAGIAPF